MGVSHERGRVAQLKLEVIDAALHPDWFSVRAFRRMARPPWEADVRLVEGGHAVIFRSGSARVTEYLAGPNAFEPPIPPLFSSAIKRERTAALKPKGLIDYQLSFEAEWIDAELFRHLCDEFTLDATRGGLFYEYPRSGRLAAPALSYMHLEPLPRGLSIQSFHTFPDEHAVVRTQSLFELAESR